MTPSADLERSASGTGLTLDASDPRFYMEANREAYLTIHAGSPVYWVEAEHTQPFWNVCTHEHIRTVGSDPDTFTTTAGVHLTNAAFAGEGAKAPPAPEMPADPGMARALTPANMMDPTHHRRVRGPLNPHFRHDEIGKLEGAIRGVVGEMLDEVVPGEEVDFMRAFAARVPLVVTAELLGVSIEREQDFERWANVILTSFEPGAEPDWPAIGEMVQFFGTEIEARRIEPREGLISDMLASSLSDEETLMWCWLLMAAGIETTGNLIGAGMDLLLRHPDQMARLCEDPSMIRPAVSEMLRVITPGRYIRRTATVDTEIAGHEISEGDPVVMNFTVANYAPAMFENPLEFDIERNPNDTLAFSFGPHRCIGMSVARLESTIAFEELLARFPSTRPRGAAVFRPSLATAVVEHLPLVFKP